MTRKYTYKGKEYSYSDLQSKYGENTDAAISKFGFEEVKPSPTKYLYNDKEYTYEDLESKYGDKTQEAIDKFGFEEIGSKKKEDTSTVPQEDLVSSSEDGSSDSQKFEEGTHSWNQEKIKQNNPSIVKLFEDFQAAKTISDDQREEIIKSVDDEINQKGIWNNIKSFGKSAYNKLAGAALSLSGLPSSTQENIKEKVKVDKNPLAEELKEVEQQFETIKKDFISNNKPVPSFTEEDKIQAARELKIEKRIQSQSESQVRSFLKESEKNLDSFGLSEKDKVNLFQASELASLSEKDKLNLAEQNINRIELSKIQEEKVALINKFESGEIPNEEEFNAEVEKIDVRYQEAISQSLDTYQRFVTNKEDIGNVKENLDVLKRNYGWLRNFADNAGATGLDLTAGLIGASNLGLEIVGLANENSTKLTRKASDALTETSSSVRDKIAKPISVEDINTMADFGQWFSNTAVASQIPIYAAVAMGGAGIAALGTSAAGSKWEEMQDEVDAGKADYNYFQKTLVPIGVGASETLSAYVDRLVLANAGRVIRSATLPERKMIAQGMWKGFANTTGNVVKNASFEGVDEAATEIMQNTLDIFVLGKKDVNIFDNVTDAMAAGVVMGGLIPASAGLVSQAIKPFSIDNKLDKVNKEILNLEKVLDNKELPISNRVILESQLSKAKVRNQSLLEQEVGNISNMPSEAFEAIKGIERTQANIKQQAQEIKSSDLDTQTKDQVISALKEEFDAVESQRINILNNDSNALLNLLEPNEVIKLKDEAARELLVEANPDGTKEGVFITDEQITERALENYNKKSSERDIDVPLSNNAENNNLQEESVQPNDIVIATEDISISEESKSQNQLGNSIVENEHRVIKASKNGKEYTINTDSSGKISFINKKGKVASDRTHKRLSLQYAKENDLTEGRRAYEVEGAESASELSQLTSKEINRLVSEKSESPVEIAETILSNEIENYREDLDYKQRIIAENLGFVNRESFIQNSDEVHAKEGGSIPIQYLRKDGSSLDSKAQELSEIAGIEITEQDIVDFIIENPSGTQTFLNNGYHGDLSALKNRFEEVTGLPATNELLEEIISQYENKLEVYEQMTSLDFMSDEELLSLLTERKQYEQETADAVAEEIRATSNSQKNEGKSGVQRYGPTENREYQERSRVSNRSSQEEFRGGEEIYRRIQEISNKLRRSVESAREKLQIGEELSVHDIQDIEKIISLEYAKEHSLWIEDFYSLGRYTNIGGMENTIALDQVNGIIYKSNNLFNSNFRVSKLLEQVQSHNKIFPETSYELVGFTGLDNGPNRTPHIEVILKQEFVPNAEKATKDEILSYMAGIGFNKITESSFTNGEFTISDLHPRNVLKNINGDIFVIDDIIEINNESLEEKQISPNESKGLSEGSTSDLINTEINLSDKLKLNSFIENLDKAIDQLDQFGKENLGMNLPLVVARTGLVAMKVAAKSAKSVADIISAGLNAVKQTDWYKNLSQAEQADLDNNFIEYLNKPFETNKNTRGRDKIEKEIKEAIKAGKSEAEIINSYSDRMEKMMAKDFFERKKALDPKTAKKTVDEAFEKSEKKMEELTKPKFDINKLFRAFVTKFFDRQFMPKFLLNKAGGRVVRDYIVTAKGASGYAKQMYEKAYDKIYKGLSSDQIKLLDKVIQLRRFIAIDENRKNNGLPDVVHPDYINKTVARTYLGTLQQELEDKAYNDLIARADAYFDAFKDLLDQMYESGIISKESRDAFFDVDYQPRQFLEFLQNAETETAHLDNGTTGGLGKEQIQKLEKGLDSALVTDSQYLLSRAMNVRAKTIALNNTTRRLAEFMNEQQEVVDGLNQKDKPTKKEKDIIKYFNMLKKRVKENPIVGFTESGNPKYKMTTPNGFSNAYYWKDGVKYNVLMENEFHEQYFDALKRIFSSPDVKEKAAMYSGTGLVKSIATGNNPTFFITNTPRDFLFISTFSGEYGKNLLLNMAKLTKDAALGIRDIKKENQTYQNFVKYGGMTDFLMDQGKFKGTSGINHKLAKIDNKTRERWGKFFDAVTLQKMQMYSEVGFRMGVFRRSISNQLKELGFKDISEVQDKRTLDDIYTSAASSARNTMDFNQGGTLTKDLDAFIPYLNAATQGTRVMFDNFRERPFETALRVTQAAALIAPIPIGLSLMFLASGDREEGEEDLNSTQLYNKALKGVSKYDRSNYFIIFNGKRNKQGEFSYYRIAKAQQLTPFFTLAEGTLQKIMRESVDDKETGTMIEDLNWILQNNISPVEFGITDNVARNPMLKAALSMSTGYDFFREQDISTDRGRVPVPAEGFGSKSVEDFYKKIGEDTGLSPARLKAAVESIITTPSTSPYVGMVYGGMDAMFSDKDTKQVIQKFAKDMAKSSVNRVVKETSEYNRRIGNMEKIRKEVEKIEIARLKTKFKFNSLISDLKDGTITQKAILSELQELAKENPFEAKRMVKRVKDQLSNKSTPSFVFEVKYANSAKEKALLLADKFGDTFLEPSKMQDKEKIIIRDLKKNGALNREVMVEYMKLVK